MGNLKEIQLGSLLATTPEALQRIADSEAVAVCLGSQMTY